MPQPSLEPVRLRMARAIEHALDLRSEIDAFYKTKPYEIVHEFDPTSPESMPPDIDPSKGQHLFRIVSRHPVPARISILAGDVFKDLRSTLDYVAWQLALAQSNTPPPTTAFPVFGTENRYRTDKERFIGGIDPAIHPVFDSVQPYLAGDKAHEHPLWVLHRMANDDKHKMPHVVGSLPSGVMIRPPPGVEDVFVFMKIGPFEEQDVVAFAGGVDWPEGEMNFEYDFTVAVAFGKDTPAQGRGLALEIDRIGIEVDATIKKFEPFFPS